jgi:2-hydroxychromene-2-carboxylate isomerase
MLRRTQDPAVKQQLIAATTEAAEAGVFGAPTCIVDNGRGRFLFWGQDRLELVERCARGWSPSHETSSVT